MRKLRYDAALVRPCGLLESEGYEAMRAWLAAGDVPDAIFAVNDEKGNEMSRYSLLVSLHVASVIVWLGCGTTLAFNVEEELNWPSPAVSFST